MYRIDREDRDREFYKFWYKKVKEWWPYDSEWECDTIWDHLSDCHKISRKTIIRIVKEYIDADKLNRILDK